MSNNKAMKLYKKNIFFIISDFIKRLFKKNEEEIKEIEQKEEKVNSNSVQFIETLKLNNKDIEPSELQIKFEKNEIDLESMSNEEIHLLNILYKKQVENLKKQIENKKTELNMLKFKSNNNLAN